MKPIEQLALEVAREMDGISLDLSTQSFFGEFATRLLDKIAEQSEPVAWMYEYDGMVHDKFNPPVFSVQRKANTVEPWSETPLYLHPPKPDTEVDLNPETFLRLIETINYMKGIAERGRGYKCPDDVPPEKFLLEYVIELEAPKPDTEELDDLKSLRLDLQMATQKLTRYRAVMEQAADDLEEAAQEISDWGQYASDYFQEKHDLQGSVKRVTERAAALRESLGGEE